MNFFEYQQQAKRNSGLLMLLFALAVAGLVVITTLFTAAMVAYSRGQSFSVLEIGTLLGWDTVATIALSISAIIGLASLYKLRQLSAGGRAVAESLGGRKINLAPQNPAEQRALNVVEEMAIASGTAVPDVYVIDDDAINAFAAGYKASDAVIGLTRGCIEQLNREQLQGVVAHEFSHVFNGDMRLNIRIVGLLHGILIIGLLGFWLLRGSHFTSRSNRSRGALLGIGAGLIAIGYTGTFFGNLIKSAVSRQREFLADASAVQFTRNNTGIAGALKRIGGYQNGSQLSASHASEFSHMYFASGLKKSFSNLFATHPPLTERISRLDPQWDGRFAIESTAGEEAGIAVSAAASEQVRGIGGATSAAGFTVENVTSAIDNSIGNPSAQQMCFTRELIQDIPQTLKDAAHDPFAARALVYRLMLHSDQSEQQKQRALLARIAHPGVIREFQRLDKHFDNFDHNARLPLMDMCIPALKALVPQQYQVFKRNLIKLLRSDGRVELWEWALYRVLMHALEGSPDRQRVTEGKHAVEDAARFILAALAHAGHRDPTAANAQKSAAAQVSGAIGGSHYLAAKRAYDSGLAAMHLAIAPLPVAADISLQRLDKAIAIASRIPPLHKPRLLKAMATTMAHDGEITAEEIELLRAVADSLDCPMPPLLANSRAQPASVPRSEQMITS